MDIMVIGGGGREHAIIKKSSVALTRARYTPFLAMEEYRRTPFAYQSALKTLEVL